MTPALAHEIQGAWATQHAGFIARLQWHMKYRRQGRRVIVRRHPPAPQDLFWQDKATLTPRERVMAMRRRRAYWQRMARVRRAA